MSRTGLFAVDFHTGGQADHLRIADFRAHGDAVGFGNMVAWVHDEVSKFAVVGEQQQAFTVLVQSADGVHPLRHILHQLRYASSAQLIVHGGHKAARLVEHDIVFLAALLKIDTLAVDGHDIAVRIDFLSQRCRTTVDFDFALLDPFLRLSSGSNSLLRKDLLYSDSLFHCELL